MGITFPIVLIGITVLLGIGSYVFMTHKLHEHQINGNEQYAKDVAGIRTRVAGLFVLFFVIQFMYLIINFLHPSR